MNNDQKIFVFIPVMGYILLWVLASPIFLLYFELFHVPLDLVHITSIIKEIPPVYAIFTAPICCIISFLIATFIILNKYQVTINKNKLLEIGVVSVLFTLVVDIITTVLFEQVNILVYPINAMYLLVYITIIPSILISGYIKNMYN